MRLSFSGAPEVAARLHVVWPRIVDSHFVARHGPGVESVEVLDPQHFKVISGTARKLTEQFWTRFAAGLAEDAAPPAESSAPPTPTDPGPEGAPPNRVA